MTSRERVIEVIEHRKPDRIPIYGWLRANLNDQISDAYGSVEAFEDKYEFDLAHLFGGPSPYWRPKMEALREALGGPITPAALLELPLEDPDETAAYDSIRQGIEHHKTQRGRFVYVQTPGIFECLNNPFGIENHLMYLALYEDDLQQVYRRQAEWNRRFAMNCLDLGVDMIHVSDDWGSQTGLMFSPSTWRRLIHPHHQLLAEAVKGRGAYLSLHSDGNVTPVLDGIVELGYDVVHPFQESAGMDMELYLAKYSQAFVIMGGLDIQTTLGFGRRDELRATIDRLVELFGDGGLLLCTSHFVQKHCTIDELAYAYDYIYEQIRQWRQPI